ncbi:hypothetical protein [Streptomyces sp. NPDC004284]|uniref:hypothetical protein n=1 Tax=Streptomyces sp. NPDC004284 TaxID=3364695 RepID=UPI00368E1DA8
MQLRTTGTRLATAVTAVLAVTAVGAGTLATAPAAFAATPAAVTATEAASALPVFPQGSDFGGVGATGFLSSTYDMLANKILLWTPYDGGESTPLRVPENGGFTTDGDVVVLGDAGWTLKMRQITLRNMADPAAPAVSIDLGALNGTYVAVLGPTSVLAQITHEDGTAELQVVTKDGATTTTRKISGLPADADEFSASAVTNDTVLVGYATGPAAARTGGRALVDLKTGTVTETYDSAESGHGFTSLMFSGSHVAWVDYDNTSGLYVTSVDRKTGERKKTVLGARDGEWYHELVGDRLVYGNPSKPARAVSLTGGDAVDLGITTRGYSFASDGTAVLLGSRAGEGDGLFRVAAGADGAPTVTKVAETGMVPEKPLAIQQVHVPDAVNLDQTGGKVTLGWTLSRPEAYVDVTLTHTATGKEFKKRLTTPEIATRFSFVWDGVIDGVDAPNGTYAVEAEATLADGTGEPVHQGWLMNVTRTANPHDFNDNGSTDVLARDSAGVLWRDDLRDRPVDGKIKTAQRTRIGAGWNTYKQIEAVGNIAGSSAGDLVALDGSGYLWQYQGRGDGSFAGRVKVGGGWGGYTKLTGGSDLNGDRRPDLLAADASGVLWFYGGTGSATRPFTTRVRVGGGWGVYNQLTAVGNIAGSSAGDLVARDASGVLWLYQGDSANNFSPRVRIGSGWGAFSQLVGAGDVNADGRPDLIGYGAGGTYVYKSTGSATAPFTRLTTNLYAGEGTKFNSVA